MLGINSTKDLKEALQKSVVWYKDVPQPCYTAKVVTNHISPQTQRHFFQINYANLISFLAAFLLWLPGLVDP